MGQGHDGYGLESCRASAVCRVSAMAIVLHMLICACLAPGPAAVILQRLAIYLFSPTVTNMLQAYGFCRLPPQVRPSSNDTYVLCQP